MSDSKLNIVARVSGAVAKAAASVLLVKMYSPKQAEFMLDQLRLIEVLEKEHGLKTFTSDKNAVFDSPTEAVTKLPLAGFRTMPRLVKKMAHKDPMLLDVQEWERLVAGEKLVGTLEDTWTGTWVFHTRLGSSRIKRVGSVDYRHPDSQVSSTVLTAEIFREVLERFAAMKG